jgi:hypothetical protein
VSITCSLPTTRKGTSTPRSTTQPPRRRRLLFRPRLQVHLASPLHVHQALPQCRPEDRDQEKEGPRLVFRHQRSPRTSKLSRTSSTHELSSSSKPSTSGASTHLQRPEDRASNMNVSSRGSMTMTTGRLLRFTNTPNTLQGPQDAPASKGATSPTSTLTSPNYIDPLSEEEEYPETAPQPATKPQNAAKSVRFAELPQVNIVRTSPETTTRTSAPPPRQTKKKNGQ